MASRISVQNLQRRIKLDVPLLRRGAEKNLGRVLELPFSRKTSLRRLEEVSVILVSDARMTRLHRQFLHQDGPTDVITFDHGEIVISVDTAKRNARRFGNSLTRELQLCLIHGLLHLHGFDDQTPAGARRMAQTQEKILRQLAR